MAVTVAWRATETARKIPAFSAVLSKADLRAAEPNDWLAEFKWALNPSIEAVVKSILPFASFNVSTYSISFASDVPTACANASTFTLSSLKISAVLNSLIFSIVPL